MSDAKKGGKPGSKGGSKDYAKGVWKGLSAIRRHINRLITAGLLFIGLMVGGASFLIKSVSEEDPESVLEVETENGSSAKECGDVLSDKHHEEKSADVKPAAVYLNMEPAFVTNFEG